MTVPADVSILLRRALIGEYTAAGADVAEAAEDCIAPYLKPGTPPDELVKRFARTRARLVDLERLMELVGGDDLSTGDDLAVPDNCRDVALLARLVDVAFDEARNSVEGFGNDADAILAAARNIERLRAVGAALGATC